MVKIEADTLEEAYSLAAKKLSCSITHLEIEVIQVPKSGVFGLFKKRAIVVAINKNDKNDKNEIKEQKVTKVESPVKEPLKETKTEQNNFSAKSNGYKKSSDIKKNVSVKKERSDDKNSSHNEIILPASFVTDQEEYDYDGSDIYADEEEVVYIEEETQICDKSHEEIHEQLEKGVNNSTQSHLMNSFFEETFKPSDVVPEIKQRLDELFKHACFDIDEIKVSEYDEKGILVEFSGKDAALLIGKEGYRYKALSYMLYNWINAKYQLQLRLEIAEFLKNQEDMISKYLQSVYENIDRDGRAQTKILDGILVQIALRELRIAYPDKYVAIRSTRDGAKFIIINSFNNS